MPIPVALSAPATQHIHKTFPKRLAAAQKIVSGINPLVSYSWRAMRVEHAGRARLRGPCRAYLTITGLWIYRIKKKTIGRATGQVETGYYF